MTGRESVGATFQLGGKFGVGRSGGIRKTSLISLTSDDRRARPHIGPILAREAAGLRLAGFGGRKPFRHCGLRPNPSAAPSSTGFIPPMFRVPAAPAGTM